MPELPDVAVMQRRLAETVVGQAIVAVDAAADYVVDGSLAFFERSLVGRTITDVRRHGAWLIVELDGQPLLPTAAVPPAIVVSFGSRGHALAVQDERLAPADWSMRLHLRGGQIVSFDYTKPIGRFVLAKAGSAAHLAELEAGPDALDPALTLDVFVGRMAGRTGPVKQHITDSRLVAGIGAIYSDEILYQARLHPQTPVESLSQADLQAIYEAMQESLRVAIEHEGNPKQLPDWMLTRMRVSNCRQNPESGMTFTKVMIAGMTSYFDPELQKLR